MGFENKYPYTDFHELNLDWVLEVVKRLESEWPEYKTAIETEWNNYKDSLTGEGGEWPTFKTAVETIISNFIHDVVGPYNENMNYQPGMFCYYDGNVYKCMTGSSAAYPRPFNSYGWFSYANQDTNSIVNDLYNYLTTELNSQNTKIYNWIMNTAAQWDSETSYVAGDYCSAIVGGFGVPPTWHYFKCIQDCTNVSVLDTDYWEEVVFATDLAERIAEYKQAMQDQYDTFLEEYQRQFGVVQTTGSSTTDVMSQKAVTDELVAINGALSTIRETLETISDTLNKIESGEYTVGKANLANNFDSKMVLTDNSGYLYRTTGGSHEVGEQNRVKKIVGASVPIIQIIAPASIGATATDHDVTFTNNGDGTVTVNGTATDGTAEFTAFTLIGKAYTTYIVKGCPNGGGADKYSFFESDYGNGVMIQRGGTDGGYVCKIRVYEGVTVNNLVFKPQVLNLTQTFGTTVANRLYALEQAQAGTGIAKAKEILVKDYYPYNVTAFTHTKTTGKQNVGFNLFDADTYFAENGFTHESDGSWKRNGNNQQLADKTFWANECGYYGRVQVVCQYKNDSSGSQGLKVRVYYADGTSETVNFPASTSYVNNKITTTDGKAVTKLAWWYGGNDRVTYFKDFCVDLYWDGERDGEYEPYQEWNYPVEDIELKGILSLDAQDNWVADGDEYLPNGEVEGNFTEYTFTGSETWQYGTAGGINYFVTTLTGKQYGNALSCTKYAVISNANGVNYLLNKTICGHPSVGRTEIYVRDDSYSDATTFASAMTGAKIVYKLVTPTESSADPYTELQNDSNWGTEKWIDNRDVPMPVFSTCEYIPDLKAKLETAPESPEEDGDYIMHRENGLNSYGSLTAWLSSNGYNKLVSITGYDATKTQTLKNVQGVFTWVDDQ